MTRFTVLAIVVLLLASCRSTRKIQTAIAPKDSVETVRQPVNVKKDDTVLLIRAALQKIDSNLIHFKTFSGKLNVDYKGSDGKSYNVNAVVRMYRDSAIWISANAFIGIEAMRVLITRDSVKVLDKLNKTYMARSVDYLQDMTALPLDLGTLQDLIIGNPVFLDPNIVSYSADNNVLSLLSVGTWFKNLLTLSQPGGVLLHSKLDDADMARNRTAELTYNDYETKKGFPFSKKRQITIAEKKKLEIKIEVKQYDLDQEVSFPFSIPKNYDEN